MPGDAYNHRGTETTGDEPGTSHTPNGGTMIGDQLLDPDSPDGEVATFGSFIGGAFREPAAARRIDVRDPATGTLIARIEDAGTEGVAAAVDAGRTAFEAWRRVPARERGALVAELARRIGTDADR